MEKRDKYHYLGISTKNRIPINNKIITDEYIE